MTMLTDKVYKEVTVDDEEHPGGLVATLNPGGGITLAAAQVVDAFRLTVSDQNGDKTRYNVIVESPSIVQPRSGSNGTCTTTQMWQAGNVTNQPRYSQRSDLHRWCDSVGCGPVMLAIMISWAEHHQNVPSAFWNPILSSTQAERRESLRNIDSANLYVKGITDTKMQKWYDVLHDWCDVTCWPHNGSGSTLPYDALDALETYFSQVTGSALPIHAGDSNTTPYVEGSMDFENSFWGDDWDYSGKKVADAIKAGRPAGVYYMEYWHYAVAWRYRLTTQKLLQNGKVISTSTTRLFRVNMGWGNRDEDRDAVWNALDIDGCYLLDLHQKRTAPAP